MATITFIGNLTKDAEVKISNNGYEYVLLQIAENIRKKDADGNYITDKNGQYVNSQTLFYSVFVNQKNLVSEVQDLKKGHATKITGFCKFQIEKDSNNFDQYILDSISATAIDTTPFASANAA